MITLYKELRQLNILTLQDPIIYHAHYINYYYYTAVLNLVLAFLKEIQCDLKVNVHSTDYRICDQACKNRPSECKKLLIFSVFAIS